MIAPNTAETVQMMTIHSTERPAIRPPSAASRLLAIPTTSSATTSGMTVILSALSHKVPTNPAAARASARTSALSPLAMTPSDSPMTSAANAQYARRPEVLSSGAVVGSASLNAVS